MILINPVSPKRMGMISHYSAVTVPIAAGILAGYLFSKGKKIKIIDEQIDPIDNSLKNIGICLKELEKPYIFGISCLTINIHRVYEITKLIKAHYPDSKVILGGIHPTVLAQESLSESLADIVVRGEGEETLFLLYEAIKNNNSYFDITGISFRNGSEITHTPDRPLINDLDQISFFPYWLFDNKRYDLGFVISSRGCPYNCSFCSQRNISKRQYRVRSCESVIREIDLLANNFKQEHITFLDDNFLVDKERVSLLCNLIIKNKLNKKIKFGCQARADNINEDIIGVLKEANFTSIGLGIETGSDRLMKVINKAETVKDNIEAVRLLRKSGFNCCAFFMFGLPSETKMERFQTYILAKGLRLKFVKFNNAVPYPGTPVFETAKKEGILHIEKHWKNFNSVGGVVEGAFSKFKLPYVPENNTEFELRRDLIRANLYFYLTQPSILISLLKRENLDWFSLPKKWYCNLQEYYHLIILGLKVLLNAIIVFDPLWTLREVLWWLRGSKNPS